MQAEKVRSILLDLISLEITDWETVGRLAIAELSYRDLDGILASLEISDGILDELVSILEIDW